MDGWMDGRSKKKKATTQNKSSVQLTRPTQKSYHGSPAGIVDAYLASWDGITALP